MAKMYPERLPATVASDAERDLFAAFRDRVGDRRTVLAGVNWIWANQRGHGRTAEADFVVLDPERGMLVIEVKGGTVGYDARSGRWHSVSRGGHDNTIKNPVEQARSAFYDLKATLGEAYATSRFQYPGGHAVAFPDGVAERGALPLDVPRAIVIDASDLDDLDGRLDSLFHFWRGSDAVPPGRAGVDAAVDLLARSWELTTPLALDLRDEASQIRTLTEQQFRVLDVLSRQPRALVNGCAGSGKTFLAAEKARRLAEWGMTTLLTCFNKALAAWLRERLAPYPDNLRIQHYHELAYDLVGDAGLDQTVPPDMPLSEFFNEHLPARLVEALSQLAIRYDAIVVDEGQDFHEDWWLSLLELLRDPDEGVFYVFYDDCQAIYNKQLSLPFSGQPFELTENLRSTQAIHRHIARFYGDNVRGSGPEGRPPVIIRSVDPDTALGEQLGRLIGGGNVPMSDIVVLTPASESRSLWKTGQRAGRYTLTWEDPPPDRQVLVSTIHSFKGLERPIVILTETEGMTEDDRLYLVACSRAKHELVVIQGA